MRKLAAAAVAVAALACGRAGNQAAAPWNTMPTPQTHSWFVISSGPHAVSCDKCHGGTDTFAKFDCLSCHQQDVTSRTHAGVDQYAWASESCYACHKDRFHGGTAPAPSSCLRCHGGERPTSTTGWLSTTFARTPFDYATHGAAQDCAACHSTKAWTGGSFPHGAGTLAGTTCFACHTSQRPDIARPSAAVAFDHSRNGTGDCFGCHQATVARGVYVDYDPVPGGDWRGAIAYPGATLIGAPSQVLTVTQTKLTRNASGFVTAALTGSVTLYNQMLHSKPDGTPPAGMPPSVYPGPPGAPNDATCSTCHSSAGLAEGRFHASVAGLAVPPGCLDCHGAMQPAAIVGPVLSGMDHAAYAASDCATCHKAGASWSDAAFHKNATGADCAGCHYPLMADSALADVSDGATFSMKHGSAQLTFQTCQVCHTGALASAAWKGGVLHASVPSQPTLCLECHSIARPTGATQSTVTYTFTGGGATATNGAQWMSHSVVAGQECATCHLADARPGGVWSRSASFHSNSAPAAACAVCHGLGTTPGSGNNMPAGVSNSSTVSSTAGSNGIPAGTLDQIDHKLVSGRDCNACHSQQAGWAQAGFHANTPTVATCAGCHLNLEPPAGFTSQDHSTIGGTDCAACHRYPTWQGAAPQSIATGGFAVPQPPAASATTQPAGTLAHPAVSTCTSCHASTGFKPAIGYDHAAATTSCNACHEAGSSHVGTAWNGAISEGGGAGDTRPYTTSVTATFKTDSRLITYPNHFYPVDCWQCHTLPSGISHVTSGSAYTADGTGWYFPHDENRMANPSTCVMCHPNGIPN